MLILRSQSDYSISKRNLKPYIMTGLRNKLIITYNNPAAATA